MSAPSIDFAQVARQANLVAILESDLGAAHVIGGKPHWPCPFHEDHSPSLYVFDDGRRWRCWPCGLTGDALDYLTRRDNIGVAEAARILDPSLDAEGGRPVRRKSQPIRRAKPDGPTPDPTWKDSRWQEAVGRLVDQAQEAIWSTKGSQALGWLRARGLADHTISMHRLGYLPSEGWTAPVPRPDGTVSGIKHERGILIPWPAPIEGDGSTQRYVGANVRRLMPDPAEPWYGADKCKALRGSVRGYLYPFAEILPTQGLLPALLVEGEIDALIAWQEVGHIVHAGTVGGAGQRPHHTALSSLARCPWWLLAFDHDAAGVEAAHRWQARAPHKSRRVLLPHGKDLGDFARDGGDVRGWIVEELSRS